MKKKLQITCTIFTLLFIANISFANFIVQTIYFQPDNAPDHAEVQNNISQLMKDTQQLYANEMDRHGFGQKTFRIEKDVNNNIIVHHVEGNNNSNHYINDTWDRLLAELPNQFNPGTPPWNKQDTIRVIIVGGVHSVNGNRWGIGWPRHSNRYGGTTFMIGEGQNFNVNLIFHEIGHCFGLYHKEHAVDGTLEHYEARWLDKHYHFNDIGNNFTFPKPTKDIPKMTDLGDDIIEFQLPVKGNIPLHQAQVYRKHDIIVLDWDYLNGKVEDTATFEVVRHKWAAVVVLQVMDIRGNYHMKNINIQLPAPKPDPEPTPEPEPRPVYPKDKLTTLWASIKMQR